MAKKSPYDVLGVSKTATPDQIKRARRKKAGQAHPDRGGDHDAMAEINHAFDILNDPARRLLYDQTGEDRKKPFDDAVRNVILEAFNDALQRDAPDCLGHARRMIENKRSDVGKQKREAETAKGRLLARRNKITVKTGENIFHLLIDQQLLRIDGALSQMDEAAKVFDAALKALKAYKTTEEAQAKMTMIYTFGVSGTGSGW